MEKKDEIVREGMTEAHLVIAQSVSHSPLCFDPRVENTDSVPSPISNHLNPKLESRYFSRYSAS